MIYVMVVIVKLGIMHENIGKVMLHKLMEQDIQKLIHTAISKQLSKNTYLTKQHIQQNKPQPLKQLQAVMLKQVQMQELTL
jgi:hypothetical protein